MYNEFEMTRRYKTLQKKLKELKAELRFVFSLPPGQNDDHNTPYHQLLSEEIQQRILFVKNLLTAEITSHPLRSRPHHLSHIAKRLTDLESAFHEWDDHRRSVTSRDYDIHNLGDAISICSCDEREAYESENTGEVGSSSAYEVEDGLGFAEGLADVNVGEDMAGTGKKAAGSGGEDQAGVVAKVRQREAGNIIGYCGGMMGGMIFGALLMGSIMLRICGCCYLNVQEAILFPT